MKSWIGLNRKFYCLHSWFYALSFLLDFPSGLQPMRVFTSTAREKNSKNFDSNWLFKFSHHLSDWLNFYTLIINLILSRLYTVMFRGAPCMIMNWPGILFSCIYFQSIFSPRPWIHWAPSSTTPSEKLWEKNTFKFLQTPYLSIRFFCFFFKTPDDSSPI